MTRTHRKVTPADVAVWCRCHDRGDTAQRIAGTTGWSRDTVIRYLERSGRTPHACFEHASTVEVRRWCTAYDAGDTINAIARAAGRSRETIGRHLIPTGRTPGKAPS